MGEQQAAYHLLFPKEIDAINIQKLSDMFSKSNISVNLIYEICHSHLKTMSPSYGANYASGTRAD